MFSARDMPSPSAIFSAYASMTASIMLLRSLANELIPQPIRGYLFNTFNYFLRPRSNALTLIIEDSSGIARNQVYDAAEAYLSTRLSPENERLKVCKSPKEKKITIRLEKGEKLVDLYDGVWLKWRFICSESEKNSTSDHNNNISVKSEKRYFELSFHKKHKEMVLGSYLPFILEKAKEMKDEERVLKMHTLNTSYCYGGVKWDSINLEHPSTFETLAMEKEQKESIMEDLNRFVKRKEFYKKVGRAWKRGYLLYGPPGTGKSSLIAAMANYLKFDIYDLQLGNIVRDSDLRKLLLATANRSILVIEDIDCSVDLPERTRHGDARKQSDVQLMRGTSNRSIIVIEDIDCNKEVHVRNVPRDDEYTDMESAYNDAPEVFKVDKFTLSALLNYMDGLWSGYGEERIIIFTTNHRDKIDPALLRPGRMDMHIHMSFLKSKAFRILASNYLDIQDHPLFEQIDEMLEKNNVTPAVVAEQLMRSEDPDVALDGLCKFLKETCMKKGQEEEEEKIAENNN